MIRPVEIIQLVGQILEKYRQSMSYQIYKESANINQDIEQLEKEIQKDRFELMLLLGLAKKQPDKKEVISIKLVNKN